MKKITVSLIGTLLVITLGSSAEAHPSGLRIDLGGNGFGFSIYDNRSGVSPYWHNNYRSYLYLNPGPYLNRPYLGWGGYLGHRHHKHWGHPGFGRHHKKPFYGKHRNHKRNHHRHHRGNFHNHRNKGHHWRR